MAGAAVNLAGAAIGVGIMMKTLDVMEDSMDPKRKKRRMNDDDDRDSRSNPLGRGNFNPFGR